MQTIPKKINNLTLSIIKGSEKALSVFFEKQNVYWDYISFIDLSPDGDKMVGSCFGVVTYKETARVTIVSITLIKNENLWEVVDSEVLSCYRT